MIGFAGDEVDSAGGAAGVAAAGVELVDLGIIGQCVDQAFAGGDFEGADGLDGEFGHGFLVRVKGSNYFSGRFYKCGF